MSSVTSEVVEGRLPYHQTMVYKGKTYTNVYASCYAYFRYDHGKDSVDDGSFVPGIYRVNPYYVIDCTYKAENSNMNRTYTHPDGRIFSFELSGNGVVYGNFKKLTEDYSTFDATAYEQLALQKAQAKVGKGEVQVGEDLGEIRETVKMLREPLSALKKFFVDDNARNLKLMRTLVQKHDYFTLGRMSQRTATAAADAAADTWMELRYGLRPLIGSLENAIKIVDGTYRKVLDPNKIYTCKTKLDFTELSTLVTQHSCGGFPYVVTSKVRDDVQATASIAFKYSGPPPTLLDEVGLSARFLPETAWALTRASFVWDWIISIGPWLESLRINPGYDVLGHTTGIKHQRTGTVVQLQSIYFDQYAQHDVPDATIQVKAYRRRVDVSAQYRPHFTWGRTLDLWKLIDSLSLIWQSMPQRKR
jgi:hypothetical protein